MDISKTTLVAQAEAARICSLAEAQEAKAGKLEEGIQVTELAISYVGDQALQKAKKIALTTIEAGKLSTLIVQAQQAKGATNIKSQLDFL